ncbi:hypothetical protein JHK82_024563 [Glycine max]|nr:hypothetical protein JHK85_025164 [Glycine max]KAG5012404.1 hypothetical protein JHK86_024665 [Glycine max]KAG5133375.1 hypothetical protein JHK82_024563 [Glycine max]
MLAASATREIQRGHAKEDSEEGGLGASLPFFGPPLPPSSCIFTLIALKKDVELIDTSFFLKICINSNHVQALVPTTAKASALTRVLNRGGGQQVLCLVLRVVKIEEPLMVLGFLREIQDCKRILVRVKAYKFMWAWSSFVEGIIRAYKEEGD